MKITTSIVFALFLSGSVHAQIEEITPPKSTLLNNIALNFFGDGSIVSINYERLFPVKEDLLLIGKIGIGYNSEFRLCLWGSCNSPTTNYLTLPLHLSGNLGKEKHFYRLFHFH